MLDRLFQDRDFVRRLADAQAGDFPLAVDNANAGIGCGKGMVDEQPHHLSFRGDLAQRHVRRQRLERILITGLVPPIEHLALEIQQGERTELEVGNDCSRWAVDWNDQHQRPFVAAELRVHQPRKVWSRNKRERLHAQLFGNLSIVSVAVGHIHLLG